MLWSLAFSPEHGGREINRQITRRIVHPLADLLVEEGADALLGTSFDVVRGEIALMRSARVGR